MFCLYYREVLVNSFYLSIRLSTQAANFITNVILFPLSSPNVELVTHKSEVQKVQRSDLDELDADHDLDQDRFEEFEVDSGVPILPSAPQLSGLPTASSMSSISPRRPLRKSSPSARRRELVWKSEKMGRSLSKK